MALKTGQKDSQSPAWLLAIFLSGDSTLTVPCRLLRANKTQKHALSSLSQSLSWLLPGRADVQLGVND